MLVLREASLFQLRRHLIVLPQAVEHAAAWGLAFLAFFAEPLPNLEEMALSILADDFEKNGACELIQDDVRTLQAYEVDFWDAVWKPSHHASRGEL